MLSKIKTALGLDPNQQKLNSLQGRVEKINELEPEYSNYSDDQLRSKTGEFKARLDQGESLDDILPEAFAVVREVSKRTLGQRHYDVQLMGGVVMHEGSIAEMKTGEGKTLAATLPVYLNALTGEGVHVVTVNDYLASRDASWMGQIYNFLGLSIGVVNSNHTSYLYDESYAPGEEEEIDEERDEAGFYKVTEEFLRPCKRPEAYQADITYGTNTEFGFDYLRDHLVYEENKLRQRGHVFTIVDEIDSILIDEARTPLIISAPASSAQDLYQTFASVAKRLKPGEDYEIDEKKRAIQLNDSGIEKAEEMLGVENLYTDQGVLMVHHLETAIKAQSLYERDKQYVIQDGQVKIVDEFTGRILEGRRYSEGLHQAIEAKEGVELKQESRTFASVTYQNYFRLYEKLSGMTGTAKSSEEEFIKVYGLEVVVVPTNRPIARIDHEDLIFQSESGKLKALTRKVKELQEKGQPVLVGTVSIEKNELLSEFFQAAGIDHEILNAKNHEREGAIIAEAGKKKAVTIATNMAGRGVDIKLGGDEAAPEEYQEVKDLGGLFVLGTERHSARRIDNQLRGRSGRQGDPGASQFFVSLDDDLMRVFASDRIRSMMGNFGIPEDEPIRQKMITRALENAQERIEGQNFDARRSVLRFDNVLNKQRKSIYDTRQTILAGDADDVISYLEGIQGDNFDIQEVIEEKLELLGEDEFVQVAKRLILQTIDLLWVEHLEVMDHARQSVNLRAYGQQDPFIEYQKEGSRLFEELEYSIEEQVVRLLPKIGEGTFRKSQAKLEEVKKDAQVAAERSDGSSGSQQPRTTDKVTDKAGDQIGRNDRVIITNGKEEKELKFKKAERLIESGEWKLVERVK